MGIALNACEFSRKWRHALALLRRVTGSRKEGPDLPGEVDFLGLTAAEWRPLEKVPCLKDESCKCYGLLSGV